MILTTTTDVDGMVITKYHGVCTGEAVLGANIIKDIFARVTNIIGGRSSVYENELREARKMALHELSEYARECGGNAVISIDLDYEVIKGSMLMVSATGTAITVA